LDQFDEDGLTRGVATLDRLGARYESLDHPDDELARGVETLERLGTHDEELDELDTLGRLTRCDEMAEAADRPTPPMRENPPAFEKLLEAPSRPAPTRSKAPAATSQTKTMECLIGSPPTQRASRSGTLRFYCGRLPGGAQMSSQFANNRLSGATEGLLRAFLRSRILPS